jgi:hypothetical protein
MSDEIIINLDETNIDQYPPTCFLNPKNEGYLIKCDWMKKRFSEGLIIKQLYLEKGRKCNGFIEYIPGENAWRAIDAPGYMFIHCIWITPNNVKHKGYGSKLIEECIKDAEKQGKNGVAVITSEGSFMAGKDIFLKNGFKSIQTAKPSFELMIKPFNDSPVPKFKNWEGQLKKYQGLNIIYSNQCPWVARSIKELKEVAKKNKLEMKVTEIKTAEQAQNAPSIYAIFNIVNNGKILADHYISSRRFENIIKKEIKS